MKQNAWGLRQLFFFNVSFVNFINADFYMPLKDKGRKTKAKAKGNRGTGY
jgi:hypothetical protein